jgi:cell division protein FtsI/penicillin-binding protein 2
VKKFTNANVGGKTGTAERILYIDNKVKKPHDGWFICFVENSRIKKNGQVYTAPLGVAVRLERLGSGMSDKAVNVTRDVVLEVLGELGYLQ